MIGVVDASALIRCFIPDGPTAEGLDKALRQAESGDMVLFAPQLLLVEAGSVILKKQRKGGLSVAEGKEILGLVAQMPIRFVEHESVLAGAMQLAIEWNLSYCDAMYLALALDRGGRLYTCDEQMSDVARKLGIA